LSTLSQRAAAVLARVAASRALLVAPAAEKNWWLMNAAAARAGTVLLPGTNQLTSSDIGKRWINCR